MCDEITRAIASYIKEKGIAVSVISEKTGLSCGVLYPSLREKPSRKLRANEFMSICEFLDVDPWKFTTTHQFATSDTSQSSA